MWKNRQIIGYFNNVLYNITVLKKNTLFSSMQNFHNHSYPSTSRGIFIFATKYFFQLSTKIFYCTEIYNHSSKDAKYHSRKTNMFTRMCFVLLTRSVKSRLTICSIFLPNIKNGNCIVFRNWLRIQLYHDSSCIMDKNLLTTNI